MKTNIIGEVFGYFVQQQMEAVSIAEAARSNLETMNSTSFEAVLKGQMESQLNTANKMYDLATYSIELVVPIFQILEAWRNGVPDHIVDANLQEYLRTTEA